MLQQAYACTDLIPGWQDKDGRDCNHYRTTKKWCTPTGAYDHEWDPEFRQFFNNFARPGETLGAADICCGCGAGLCKDEKQWLDSRGWSCDQYYQEGWCPSVPAGERLEDYAVNNVSAADACCHCGGGCQSSPTWSDSAGNNCSSYYSQQWCAWTGGVGPGWNSSWGQIEDYAVNGTSAWDACCECSRCKDDQIFFSALDLWSFAALGCKVVRRMRLLLFITDFLPLSNVKHIHILEVIQTMATSMAGLEGTTVGDFRLVGNGQMRTLEGLGKAYDNVMNFFTINMPLVKDFSGVPAFSKVQRKLWFRFMDGLESIASLGHLRQVGWMQLQDNQMLKSLHGLEHVHTITTREWLQHSVRIQGMPALESFDALAGIRGPLTGILDISMEPSQKWISSQGFRGITTTCTAFCFAFPIRFRVLAGLNPESFCFPAEDEAELRAAAGPALEGPVIEAPSFGAACTRCPDSCGYLPDGYTIPCDYQAGLCRCPLGTRGPNCTAVSAEVRMLPGQTQECQRPRKSEGDITVCEVCVAVQTNDYDPSLDPPRTVRMTEVNSSEAWPWPQQITWPTAKDGILCTNVSLAAADPPLGVQRLELTLAYAEHTQDFILPGSIRNPLRHPVDPVYPWCLDSGDCTRIGNDTASLELTISEPPVGRVEFAHKELRVREGSVGAVVVNRVGGDYGTLTATIEVDNTSVAVQDVHYLWSGVTLSWLHGDARPKAFAVVLKDNSVAENDVVLELRLASSVSDRSSIKLWIQDDGDAGQLGFTDRRLVRPEASLSDGCLFHARRDGGSSGPAAVRVEVAECVAEDSPAQQGEDFLFAPGLISWEDGEVSEKCAVLAATGTVGLAAEGPARLAVLEDANAERDEVVCIGLTMLNGSVAEVTTTDSASFGPMASLSLLDRGPDGGPTQAPCVHGRVCYVDLSTSNLAHHLAASASPGRSRRLAVAPYVSLAVGSCPICDASSAVARAELNESFAASWGRIDLDPAQYLVCLCACSGATCPGSAVASLTVTGIQDGQQAICSLGQQCRLPAFQGLGLQAGDALTAQESCGQTELLKGLPSAVAMDAWGNGSYAFASSEPLFANPGLFNLCWCRPSQGSACNDVEDFEVQVGLFKVDGPATGQSYQCFLNETCRISDLAGTGLKAGDRLMAKEESCDGREVASWGAETSVAVTEDGRNFNFGLLTHMREVPQELALCWCPASANCQSPIDFRATAGRLTLQCPQNFYWPTADGVVMPRGECQACSSYQKTVQRGSVGRASCVCKTRNDGWPFQQVTDGNCGCRDGFHWSAADNGCLPCNEGQDCLWENLFSRSLDPPPLVPGHWSNSEGSVYRCFSTGTCPFTNSTCAVGRTGKACALCKEGFIGGHDGECKEFHSTCAQQTTEASIAQWVAIGVPVAIILISIAMIVLAGRHAQVTEEQNKHVIQTLASLREALAQNFQYLQLLSIVSLFKVRWPPLLSEIWVWVRSITSELITIPNIGCILPHPSSFNEMLARYLIPVVLAAMTLISWLLIRLVRKGLSACSCRSVKVLHEKTDVRSIQMLELLVLTGTLFYSLVVRNGFILFTCSLSPNGISSVVIYPHIDCPSPGADLSDWLQLFPYALAYNFLFSFGFTFLVWYAARKVAEHMVSSAFSHRGPWAFVATEFRDTYIWWLFLKMMKDLQINILAVVFTNLGSIQLLSTAVVSTIYGYFCAHHHPFKDPMNNLLEVWCALSIAAICFFASGMGFAYDAEDDYAETALENEGLNEDGSLRAQILLSFQLISFVGGFGIMFVQLFGVAPGCARWIPKSLRPRKEDEREEAVEELNVAFKAADLSKLDDVTVARNFALLQESRASLKLQLRRSGSLTRLLPGRHYMAQLMSKEMEREASRQFENEKEDVSKSNAPRTMSQTKLETSAAKAEEAAGDDEMLRVERTASGQTEMEYHVF